MNRGGQVPLPAVPGWRPFEVEAPAAGERSSKSPAPWSTVKDFLTVQTPEGLMIAALVNAITLAAILIVLALPARAQSTCAPRDYILSEFAKRHHERPVAMGLAANGAVIEVLVTEDGKTWTVIATGPTGVTCIAASGTSWEALTPEYGERN